MDFHIKFPIVKKYLPVPTARRRGIPMKPGVRFIVAHDTGNPNSTAAQNVDYFIRTANPTGEISSAHFFVDATEIIECIPVFDLGVAPEKAWHVRPTDENSNCLFDLHANDAAIGIEYCFGTNIDSNEAYRRYVWLIAYACFRFSLDPAVSVVGHFILDPHRKTDPVTGLAYSRRSYDCLLADIVKEYVECTGGNYVAPAVQDPNSSGSVRATVRLNIRLGKPSSMAPVCGVVEVGGKLDYIGVDNNGYSVNGNTKWYRNVNGNFFWSGGTSALDAFGAPIS